MSYSRFINSYHVTYYEHFPFHSADLLPRLLYCTERGTTLEDSPEVAASSCCCAKTPTISDCRWLILMGYWSPTSPSRTPLPLYGVWSKLKVNTNIYGDSLELRRSLPKLEFTFLGLLSILYEFRGCEHLPARRQP